MMSMLVIPHQIYFDNYSKIVDTLRAHQIIPIIQSTLFVASKRDHSQTNNEEILQLDKLLLDICA